MMNWYSKTLGCVVLVPALVFAGCRLFQKRVEKVQEDVDVLASKPDIETLSVTDGFTPRAIGASGGYRAWVDTDKLDLQGVVTLYNNDGSYYLTEHQHEVYPWTNSIRISGREPHGSVAWQLAAEQYSVRHGAGTGDSLSASISKRDFADAILSITTSPIRLLDKSYRFVDRAGPVKIDGQWYLPIERQIAVALPVPEPGDVEPPEPSEKSHWSRVVFYQRRDGSLVDMISFADIRRKTFIMVRGYDYRAIGKRGVLLPTKIEIFKTDAGGDLRHRLAKIDYHSLSSAQ